MNEWKYMNDVTKMIL